MGRSTPAKAGPSDGGRVMSVANFSLVKAYSFMARHGFSAQAAAIREDKTDYGRARTSRLKRARVVALIIDNDLLSTFVSEAWPDGSTKRGAQLVAQMRRLHDEYEVGSLSPNPPKTPAPPLFWTCGSCGRGYDIIDMTAPNPCLWCGASVGEQHFRSIANDLAKPKAHSIAGQPGTIAVQYSGHREFNKDRAQREKDGWYVMGVQEVKQPAGLGRIATLGLGALVVKPKSQFYVTYGKGVPTGRE